jgi:small subunit ribosomal protein S13|tara:strand:+ start:61 stop:429 length:369 start_codon:yes stop_codon:yes gene_type:complete
MARISGVDLPRNKRIEIGLTYVFGIGNTSAKDIVKHANVDPSTKCGELTDEQITSIRAIIDNDYQTEGDLRRFVSQNLKRLTDIGSAKGRRHRVGLPVRGQRTKTNARTRKGKIKIPVTKKK